MRRESEVARWLALLWFGTGTVFGIGLLIVGVGLVALGIVVTLNGFGRVTVALPDELGTSLAAGLVIGVTGGLALGLGVESQAGHGYVSRTSEAWEVAISHLPGFLLFAWVVAIIGSIIERIIADAPEAFGVVPRYLDAVGGAWIPAAVVGLPALWAIHQFMVPRESRFADFAPAALFVAWALATISAF